eukprot:jgi/Phyca11/133569/e_gw1.562.2.1
MEEFSDVSTKKLIPPTADEWFMIQCLVELLAPFQTATKYLNAEVYPTDDRMFDVVSASVHHEWFCERVLAKMHSVRLSFIRLLNQRFKEVMDPELLWISLLDPYLATTYFLTPEETKVAKKNMLNEMIPIMREVVNAPCGDLENESPQKATNNPTARADASWFRKLYGAAMDDQERQADEQIKADCKFELNRYLIGSRNAKVKKHQKKHPSSLEWWRSNHALYPTIAELARKWLSVIATSVPSERAFSTAGNTVTKRRSSLKADTVSDIIFMAQNVGPQT